MKPIVTFVLSMLVTTVVSLAGLWGVTVLFPQLGIPINGITFVAAVAIREYLITK